MGRVGVVWPAVLEAEQLRLQQHLARVFLLSQHLEPILRVWGHGSGAECLPRIPQCRARVRVLGERWDTYLESSSKESGCGSVV